MSGGVLLAACTNIKANPGSLPAAGSGEIKRLFLWRRDGPRPPLPAHLQHMAAQIDSSSFDDVVSMLAAWQQREEAALVAAQEQAEAAGAGGAEAPAQTVTVHHTALSQLPNVQRRWVSKPVLYSGFGRRACCLCMCVLRGGCTCRGAGWCKCDGYTLS